MILSAPRLLLLSSYSAVASPVMLSTFRRVVDRGGCDVHRGDVAVGGAVSSLVGEDIGAVVVGIRRVGVGAVRVQAKAIGVGSRLPLPRRRPLGTRTRAGTRVSSRRSSRGIVAERSGRPGSLRDRRSASGGDPHTPGCDPRARLRHRCSRRWRGAERTRTARRRLRAGRPEHRT